MASPDPFDALLNVEETLMDSAFDDGFRTGRVLGYAEGHALGTTKGGEVGEELGFYAGAAEVIARARRRQLGVAAQPQQDGGVDAAGGDKILRVAQTVLDLCLSAPLANPASPAGDSSAAGGTRGHADHDGHDEDDSERPAAPPALEGSGAAGEGSAGPPDVFSALQQARAKFRLLVALAKLPGLAFDPARLAGERDRGF